jgi:hypothetical protein
MRQIVKPRVTKKSTKLPVYNHPIAGQVYVLSHNMGIINISNGTHLGHLTWLGGNELIGDAQLIAIANLANLAKKRTSKSWSIRVGI